MKKQIQRIELYQLYVKKTKNPKTPLSQFVSSSPEPGPWNGRMCVWPKPVFLFLFTEFQIPVCYNASIALCDAYLLVLYASFYFHFQLMKGQTADMGLLNTLSDGCCVVECAPAKMLHQHICECIFMWSCSSCTSQTVARGCSQTLTQAFLFPFLTSYAVRKSLIALLNLNTGILSSGTC